MRKFFCAALAAVCIAIAPTGAFAHGVQVGDLAIGHPWSLALAPGAPTVAGYLTITNNGAAADTLIGVETDQAESVSMHQSVMEKGMSRMLPVKSLEIASGKTVTFGPSSYHLMLVKPKGALPVGSHFFVTLRFQRAGAVKADFVVQASPPGGRPAAPGAQHNH